MRFLDTFRLDGKVAVITGASSGLRQDFPLANVQAGIQARRFADGPDEVHRNALGRDEIRRQAARREA